VVGVEQGFWLSRTVLSYGLYTKLWNRMEKLHPRPHIVKAADLVFEQVFPENEVPRKDLPPKP